ncbi:MAG: 1-(5-phosphoribosyl)-5-[(5-phosphoribosylamino)methylideneamino]imidazole-4-carboxamide isomerase [Bacteroidota bacterium]
MLAIPAIDIYEGRCIRLQQGDYSRQTVYPASPSEVARKFSNAGISFLHIVDLQGAKEKKVVNWDSISAVVSVPGIAIEVGGGIRRSEDIRRLIELGVQRVIVGSVAAKSPELTEYWIQQFGDTRIVIGVDVKNGSVAVNGWLEDAQRGPVFFLQDMIKRGATTFICTDISRDGMLQGPNVEFYKGLTASFPAASIIASGGIARAADLTSLLSSKVQGVVIGKAIYEGTISLEEIKKFNEQEVTNSKL